jgi:hypothetical protein
MKLFWIVASLAAAGASGGLANALISSSGFGMPAVARVDNGLVVYPGCLGNMLIGSLAAVLSYCFYGPLATVPLIASHSSVGDEQKHLGSLFAALAGAILVGYSGGRWITSESEKQFALGTAAVTAEIAASLDVAAGPPSTPSGPITMALTDLSDSIRSEPVPSSYEKALGLLQQVRTQRPQE